MNHKQKYFVSSVAQFRLRGRKPVGQNMKRNFLLPSDPWVGLYCSSACVWCLTSHLLWSFEFSEMWLAFSIILNTSISKRVHVVWESERITAFLFYKQQHRAPCMHSTTAGQIIECMLCPDLLSCTQNCADPGDQTLSWSWTELSKKCWGTLECLFCPSAAGLRTTQIFQRSCTLYPGSVWVSKIISDDSH